VWSIRVRLQVERRARNLALFNLAIDSKLRGCDLVRLQVDDVSVGARVRDRATIVQKKTGRPVLFEITEQTRAAIQATRRTWPLVAAARAGRFYFIGIPHRHSAREIRTITERPPDAPRANAWQNA
jgi:integrase